MCCPSRSELLTSRYFHNLRVNSFQGYPLLRNASKNAGDVHGMRPECVRADDPGSGCCMNVNVSTELQDSSFAGVLQKAGWRTGMFGKYLNSHGAQDGTSLIGGNHNTAGMNSLCSGERRVPKGWDRFCEYSNGCLSSILFNAVADARCQQMLCARPATQAASSLIRASSAMRPTDTEA